MLALPALIPTCPAQLKTIMGSGEYEKYFSLGKTKLHGQCLNPTGKGAVRKEKGKRCCAQSGLAGCLRALLQSRWKEAVVQAPWFGFCGASHEPGAA